MRWVNTTEDYGGLSIAIHWLSVVVIVGLFALGLWMVTLDYYHAWYRQEPDMHRSIGVLFLGLTGDQRPIMVFDWFAVPATVTAIPGQADAAGVVHEYLAYTLIGLALLHMLAALKHHVVDRDGTLRRMLGLR